MTVVSLADQVAAIDAAARIADLGTRAAIGASTAEIVLMAQRFVALTRLADLTFDMLATADLVQAERNLDTRRALQRAFKQKVDAVGVSLEALGYGQPQPETTTNEEPIDGTAN